MTATTVTTQDNAPIREISVQWSAPTNDGGNSIVGYDIEWYSTARKEEIQRVSISNSIAGQTSGNFQLWFDGHGSEQVSWDATPEDIRAALMGINSYNSIGDVDVSRTTLSGGYAWEVTFKSQSDNDGDMLSLIVKGDNLAAGTGGFQVWSKKLPAASAHRAIAKCSAFRRRAVAGPFLAGLGFSTRAHLHSLLIFPLTQMQQGRGGAPNAGVDWRRFCRPK